MEFSEVIRNRYSCKKYDGRQIEKEQLDQILEAGRLAPTAKNLQEQRIYVIQTEEGLAKIDKLTPCRKPAGLRLRLEPGSFERTVSYTHLTLPTT